jgi:hypothetical protein
MFMFDLGLLWGDVLTGDWLGQLEVLGLVGDEA